MRGRMCGPSRSRVHGGVGRHHGATGLLQELHDGLCEGLLLDELGKKVQERLSLLERRCRGRHAGCRSRRTTIGCGGCQQGDTGRSL
jgi:hypothetical protein